MGYTRYFTLEKKTTKKEVEKIAVAVKSILDEHKDLIQFEFDIAKPAVVEVKGSNILIRFNGIENEGHETFLFDSKDSGFNFCKTARKPYDLVVYKVLLVLGAVLNDKIDISGDGESFAEETVNKVEFLNKHNLLELSF